MMGLSTRLSGTGPTIIGLRNGVSIAAVACALLASLVKGKSENGSNISAMADLTSLNVGLSGIGGTINPGGGENQSLRWSPKFGQVVKREFCP